MKNPRFLSVPFIILFSLWLLPGAARADFAQRLNYQGRLTDANGVPVADAAGASMTFDICTDSNCSTVVWTEIATVDIEDGLFSAVLGGTTALSGVNFDSAAYYIQVTYSGNTYTPPQRLTAAAMALNVRDSSITSAKVSDNTLTAGDLLVNVVSSVDGVTNDGGDVDLVAGGGVTITPDDGANTITLAVNTGAIDHGGLGGLGDDDHPQYFALDQDEAVTGAPTFSDNVTFTNKVVAFNGGVSGASAPFTVDSTYLVSNLNADLLDGQSGAYYLDDTTVGVEAVYNAGGNIDFVPSGNITITGDDGANTVTFAVNVSTIDHGGLAGLGDNDHPQYVLDGCADCLNATEIADIYVLNTSDTMSGSLGVGTDLTVSGNIIGDILVDDTRAVNDAPTAFDREVSFDFKSRATVGVGGSGTYSGMLTIAPWGDNSGDASHQLNFNEGGIFWRQGQPDAAVWDSWYQVGYSENLDDRYVNITGDTMSGELITPAIRLPAAGYSSGAPADIGDVTIDYPANAGWAGTYNANLLLSGLNSTSIGFHDSGHSVGVLRYTNNNFYLGETGAWGVSNLTVGGDSTVSGGDIYLTDANTRLTEGGGNALRVQTDSGYVDVGPMNTSWSHFQTDRTQFYFNKQVGVNGHAFPYTDDSFDLGTPTNRWRKLYVSDAMTSPALIVTGVQQRVGPGTGADNQTHTVTCDPGYAITNLSVYATNYLDGNITITCYYLGDLLNTGVEAWEDGSLETCDGCWHYANCTAGRVARGIRMYASSRLDTNLQLLCTSVASGNYDAGSAWTVTGSNDEGDDDIMYGNSCPAGSYLSRLAIYANTYLDGDLRFICTAPK